MSTITSNSMLDRGAEESSLEYRAIHSGALLGALLGLLSGMLLFATENLSSCLALVPIPLVAMFVSLRAWLKIRRNRDMYTGGWLALGGLLLAFLFLATGVGIAGYTYATEVPDGYARISFLSLKPNQHDERAGRGIPDEMVHLLGKPVFIKGYIRPDSTQSRHGVEEFLLVRDNNQCCFGDLESVKYFDQMAVRLVPPLTTDADMRLRRVGGRLICNPQNLGRGAEYPVYYLEADHVE